MIYVFDTSSLRSLQHFYPRVFKTIWNGLDELVVQRSLVSTREVFLELERQAVSEAVLQWAKTIDRCSLHLHRMNSNSYQRYLEFPISKA